MDSVDVKRVPEGYAVSCVVRSLPAAMKAVDVLLGIEATAFEPCPVGAAVENVIRHHFADGAHPLNLPRVDEGS